jgi:Immunity protein 22
MRLHLTRLRAPWAKADRTSNASLVVNRGRSATGGVMSEHLFHIWLGLFGPEAPDNYFVQEYLDDETPQSQFGAEQGQHSFDYDFVEISFPNEPRPVRALVDGHSYSESYLDVVVQKAIELGINQANVFVLANKDEFESPRSVNGPGYELWYLGEFVCRD